MDKLSLKWNDFKQNIASSYHDLLSNGDFTDVTLACEEDRQIEAHRLILSACSPFFNRVLKNNRHSHPMIYMRGLKSKNLMAIVDFIYHGEVNIFQEDLESFMTLAEELQLKGLTTNYDEKHIDDGANNHVKEQENNHFSPMKELNTVKEEKSSNIFEYQTTQKDGLIFINIFKNMDELDERISSMMTKIEGSNQWSCKFCGKTDSKSHTSDHIESKHIEGVSHPCNQCGTVSRSKSALRKHKFRNHNVS